MRRLGMRLWRNAQRNKQIEQKIHPQAKVDTCTMHIYIYLCIYCTYIYIWIYIYEYIYEYIYVYIIYIKISYNIMCPNQIRYAIYFHLTPSPKTPQGSHWRWQLWVDEAERDLHHGQWCDHHWHLVESMPMVVVCQMISEKWYTNNRWFGEESSHLSPPWLSVTPQWLVGKMMKMLA